MVTCGGSRQRDGTKREGFMDDQARIGSKYDWLALLVQVYTFLSRENGINPGISICP